MKFNEKLIELRKKNGLSQDYTNTTQKYNGKIRMEYEYKSKTKIKGIPLVHINVWFGLKKAKGIIAIGNIAQGLISISNGANKFIIENGVKTFTSEEVKNTILFEIHFRITGDKYTGILNEYKNKK